MLKITLTSGLVGKKTTQRKVVEGLGLGKYGSTVTHADSPTIRGMVNKVSHLVTVEKLDSGKTEKAEKATKVEKTDKATKKA